MLPDFEVVQPRCLDEALALLDRYQADASILAGGTDLLPSLKDFKLQPKVLVDIQFVGGLDRIVRIREATEFGSMCRHSQIASSSVAKAETPLLSEACGLVGSPQIRHRGTLGGNIATASPAGDTLPALVAMGAHLVVKSIRGERHLPVEGFFLGPGKTLLRPDEIITNIVIPRLPCNCGYAYCKVGRRNAMAISVVNGAVVLVVEDGVIAGVRIALGSVAPSVVRARSAEAALIGQKLDDRLLREVSRLVVNDISPISDVRASAWYRRELAQAVTEDLLRTALDRVKSAAGAGRDFRSGERPCEFDGF